jgi:hypothetical protein
MSTIVTRSGKGSPLTHTEVDNNFTNLNTDKVESSAIGVTVQPYDADTAKLDVSQSWSAAQSFNAGVTLGDASGDALTINSSAVSIPNGLNFDSNTFVIDATNNYVGIGTSSPQANLNIVAFEALRVTDDAGFISFYNSANSTRSGYLQMQSAGASQLVVQANQPLAFSTNNTERMRIDSTGNVGIGTTTPAIAWSGSAKALQIVGTGSVAAGVRVSTANANAELFSSGSTTEWGLYSGSNSPFTIYTNGSERMRIDSSGNVGIGTASPSYQLDVQGSTTTAQIRSTSTTAGNFPRLIFNHAGNDGFTVGGGDGLRFLASNTTEVMRITGAGNVGIGTTSPAGRLHVAGSNSGNLGTFAGAARALRIGADSTESTIQGVDNTGVTSYRALALGAGSYLRFLTGSDGGGSLTEAMRIDGSGNLFLGATSSALNGTRFLSFTSDNQSAITARATNASQGNDVMLVRVSRNTTSGAFQAITYYNDGAGAYKFIVADSGNVTNTNGSYGTISDQKLKENIVDATPKLDKVNQLKVRNFNLIGEELKQIGFVAQEFEQVFPSIVEESQDRTPDGEMLGTSTKTIKTTVLIPILVKAIQEQQAIINDLKARIETLESK